MLNGFATAMNPSLGLLGCCEGRVGKSAKSSCETNCGNKGDGLQPNDSELACSISSCGVGIGFLQDTSGALLVSTLMLEGA